MVVKVTSEEAGGRVMIVDRLPAGFEIENPRLVESGSVQGLSFVRATASPEHTEFRDDRFVAAFNFSGGNVHNEGDAAAQANAHQGEGDGEGTETNEAAPEMTPPAAADPAKPSALTATVAYIVRAVRPGTFVHPAATVEDMYRPERYARTAAGTLSVGSKE